MIRIFGVLVLLASFTNSFGWGDTGHRTIGEIADMYLTKKARKRINKLLLAESIAISSTWMDNQKSDSAYDHMYDWHWVTIPDGMTYQKAEKNPKGDVIQTINRVIKELKEGKLSGEEEVNAIRILVHLIGDIHQPLHVGNGKDRGGNDVKLKWFWNDSNLHRVWDSEMIDRKRFSYTELAKVVNYCSKEQVKEWQNSSTIDWAVESYNLREQVYAIPENQNLRYRYVFDNWGTVKLRLLQAGVRLAGVLNSIYG